MKMSKMMIMMMTVNHESITKSSHMTNQLSKCRSSSRVSTKRKALQKSLFWQIDNLVTDLKNCIINNVEV